LHSEAWRVPSVIWGGLRSSAGLVWEIFHIRPGRSLVVIGAVLLAGVGDLVGIAALFPLLTLATGDDALDQTGLEVLIQRGFELTSLTPDIVTLLTLFVIAIIVKGAVMLMAMRAIGYLSVRIGTMNRERLIAALMKAKWQYIIDRQVGSLANALGIESLRSGSAAQAAHKLVAMAIQAAIYLGIAALVSPLLTVGAVGAGIVVMAALAKFVGLSRRSGEATARSLNSLLARSTDALTSMKPLKSMAQERHIQAYLYRQSNVLDKAMRSLVIAKEAVSQLREPIIALFLAPLIYVAIVVLEMPLANLLILVLIFYRCVTSIGTVQQQYQALAGLEAFYTASKDKIASAESSREPQGGTREPIFESEIRIDNVSFGHGQTAFLNNLDAAIRNGQVTAFIGPSGAGKTTLIDLVVGLNQPMSGRILVDGVPLSELDLHSWRQKIGYVPQEMILFHETILQNVTLGDPTISSTDVEESLRTAGVWDAVVALPESLDTVVGESGSKLSGGQRQRVAIARALARKPQLLILDEPTSALDPVTEAELCKTLRELSGRVTILVISHQPAIVDIADVVYRIQNGRIVSQDNMAEEAALEPSRSSFPAQ